MKPLKVHIYTKKQEVCKTYIILGEVDNAVKKALDAMPTPNTSQATLLRKYYGPNWRMLLSVSETKHGGDIEEEEITLNELNAIANIQSDLEEPETVVSVNTTQRVQYIYNIDVYPHDTSMDFKRKLAIITGIPIYKQHIWYDYSKKRFNLGYTLYLEDKAVSLSMIKGISSTKDFIEEIPILIDFYNAKKLLTIKTHDTTTLMQDINTITDEFHLMNLDEFIGSNFKKPSANELEIIYYGFISLFWPMLSIQAWGDYLRSSSNFEKIYPDLSNTGSLTSIPKHILLEQAITNEAQDLIASKRKKEIEKDLYIGITSATLIMTSRYTANILDLRNAFDSLSLDDTIHSMKCSIIHEGQRILMNKFSKLIGLERAKAVLPLRCLVLRLQDSNTAPNNQKRDIALDLTLFPDGNVSVKARWPEEELYDFDKVFNEVSKRVNIVIDRLNGFGSHVVHSNATLERMNKSNTRFSEACVSLIYRAPIKYFEFKIIENILKDYEAANLLMINQLIPAENVLEYYFLKGMHKFDLTRLEKYFIVENQYSFLTDAVVKEKWQQLFIYNRNTTFQYRNGSIKVSVEGIREMEFGIFYMYILEIFNKLKTQKQLYSKDVVVTSTKSKRNIKTLKHQDPVLYDFKKLYNSPIIYSKICQKPYQPVILTNEEVSNLPKNDQTRVVKYWNFTTNSPANYFCPNTKYPYIQFTVKRHPKDFCIPCCKIKPLSENDNKIKKTIFETCMKEHSYKSEKLNMIQDTRYIMNYGKFVTPGRICNLPENTIEPLLYENFTEGVSGMEPQCEDQNRYYIYGIEQNTPNIQNVGFITTLAFSLDLTLEALIQSLIKSINEDTSRFHMLLDGDIYKHFDSVKTLIAAIKDTFIGELATARNREIPWNEIFIDLAYYYLNILPIIFIDRSIEVENIKLLVNGKISTKEQIMDPNYQTLLLIKKKRVFNPIIYLNSIVYFRSKLITAKLYKHTDNVINILQKVIDFEQIKRHKSQERAEINLYTLDSFLKSPYNKKYHLTAYFINNNNLCYYVEIKYNAKKIYFPVKYSSYTVSDTVEIIYDCFLLKKHKTQLHDLNEFIKYFNHWIALESESKGLFKQGVKKSLPLEQRVEPIYDYIRADKWLLLDNPFSNCKPLVLGFKHKGINYYFCPIAKEVAKKISNAPFEQLLYHPDDVNQTTCSGAKIKTDPRVCNILKSMYDYHLYEILILELTELLNKERNLPLRHLIKKELLNNLDVSSYDTLKNIDSEVTKYFSKFENETTSKIEDMKVLTDQINGYMTQHHNKKHLFDLVDSFFYNFDRIKINELKSMPYDKIVQELHKMCKNIVKIVTRKELDRSLTKMEDFPNMLMSCQRSSKIHQKGYCAGNKLYITKPKLDELISILASDILNPFKQKWIFSVIFTNRNINYFRFIKKENESIIIESQ